MTTPWRAARRPAPSPGKPSRARARRPCLEAPPGDGPGPADAAKPPGHPSGDRGRAVDRAHAAADYYEATRRRGARIDAEIGPRIDLLARRLPDPAAWGEIRELQAAMQEAVNEEVDAEEALILAIRLAAPGKGDPSLPHAFPHRDGRLYVALPDGSSEVDCRQILVVGPAGQVGVAPASRGR